ncbi:MAG TPA: polyketide synthase, partial [Chloroflexota bacterium]
MSEPAADNARSDRQDVLRRALVEIKDLRARVEVHERLSNEPIAIVGVACRLPGDADTPEAYWQLLASGRDATCEVPDDRWDVSAHYDPDPATPGKMYTRRGGFLGPGTVDRFDPLFFDISLREAISLDPQQRLLLELTWEALESGDISPSSLKGRRVGVFVGITTNDYGLFHDPSRMDPYVVSGNSLNFAAGRLAFTLGVHGPTMAIDTACSSSLVAVHLACASLRSAESDAAIVGGVNLMLAPDNSVYLSRSRMLSPDGRCKTFDASADGYGRGEGGGVVVLKRLSDARAAGDRVLALIRGSAVNQDGPSSGLTVPNGAAQQALIRSALAQAHVAPGEVGYVEAHGTGTALGDPIELQALGAVYGVGRPSDRPLLVGSAKTNFGHLEAAAGIAGLIKTVLLLQHRQVPPHLHLRTPSPYIPWAQLPIRVPVELTDWPEAKLAGVSSFGVSGTNAHV